MEVNETELSATTMRKNSLMGVQIELTISVGRAKLSLAELVKLEKDAIVPLESKIDDPVEIFVGDRLIARGELEENSEGSGGLAVRLTEVVDLSDGL